jgi:hypothetical protein
VSRRHRRALRSALAAVESMTEVEFREAMADLCDRGLLTCTRGHPGDDHATYALGWLPLDDADGYPEEIRRRHAENMSRLRTEDHA